MNKSKFDNKLSEPGLAFQPLYMQVEEHVKQLIVEQRWKPGEMIPNEFKLASELGVSQGTVRKALNGLTSANILTRRQGVGTFVSEHTSQHSLYRFFPLISDGKSPELPKAELLSVEVVAANEDVSKGLEIEAGAEVVLLSRRRILNNEFCIYEQIFLPYADFHPLIQSSSADIPHTLYHFYQTKFNLTVQNTKDMIKADIANDHDAKMLGIRSGEALLEVVRIASAINGKVIEYRVSRCRSDKYHYLVNTK